MSASEPLWQTRLRSFGTYDGVLSFRHDVHGMRDYTFLDYQIQNLIPASYDIEDPAFSTNIDEAMAQDWVDRTTQHSFIEPALHNDSSIGDPPTAIFGKGLFEHVCNAEQEPRHPRLHLRPPRGRPHASRDHRRDGLSLCPGQAHPRHVHLLLLPHDRIRRARSQRHGGRHDRRQAAHLRHRRAPNDRHPGHLVSFHPVVTTDKEWRTLRGWDRTHEYDAAYELVETIFGGHSSRDRGVDDRLENGVYSFQYHPELARDPSVNNGKGTLDYVRYCINLAERSNYWIATQPELYQRMADYEASSSRCATAAAR